MGLLKQETVSGSGISWAICKSAPRSRQITTPVPHFSVFLQAGWPFLPPNQSTEGSLVSNLISKKGNTKQKYIKLLTTHHTISTKTNYFQFLINQSSFPELLHAGLCPSPLNLCSNWSKFSQATSTSCHQPAASKHWRKLKATNAKQKKNHP